MKPGGTNSGPQRVQENFNHEQNSSHARDNTAKHQYEDHEKLTDDSRMKEGKYRKNEDVDLRDKQDNLADQ